MSNFAPGSGVVRRPRLLAGAIGIRGRWQRYIWISVVSAVAASGQNSLTDTSNATLAAVLSLGSLTPGNSAAVTWGQTQFRLTADNKNGYRLDASASFVPGAAATVNGGDTISAADVGIGITSLVPDAGSGQQRTDVILAGFNYDPSMVAAVDGLTPYNGAANGKATLADLSSSKTILSGSRIPGNPHFLTVTMKFGILPQYFSPASFSGIITLTISTGP